MEREMMMYRVSIHETPPHKALKYWEEFQCLISWINNRIGTEAVRLFPTTEERESIFEVALLVERNSAERFASLAPEIRRQIQKASKGKKFSFGKMELAEARPHLPLAKKSGDGWTVDGIEMVDVLSP